MDENTNLHLQKFLDSKSMKIGSLKFSTLLSLLCFLSLIVVVAHAQQQPGYLHHVCSRNATFPFQNSTYNSNLNLLLTSLSSNSTNGFSTSSSGQAPNTVYALFLCRGDVGTTDCQNCVKLATEEIVQRCPIGTVVIIWYDQCLLRYSNTPIVSTVAREPAVVLINTQEAVDQARLDQLMAESTSDTVARAVRGQKFAVKEVNFTGSTKLYTLVQCTPDLSVSDCNSCLGGAIGRLYSGIQGGRVLLPSCNVRYELYPFYNATGLASPTSSPAPSPSTPAAAGWLSKGDRKKQSINVPVIASLVPISVLFLIITAVIWKMRQRRVTTTKESLLKSKDQSIKYSEIVRITKNFKNVIGEGGFGKVYLGELKDGTRVAVKMLSDSSKQGYKEFRAEVQLLMIVHHKNLVSLIGYCDDHEKLALVYEFMAGGNLHQHLSGTKTDVLNWRGRLQIAADAALGLEYLHNGCKPPIIHRDLKPSNILLNENLHGKISDFGLSKVFGTEIASHITTRPAGTFGYLDPEFQRTGNLSKKSDVYSFGILLFELITGKPAIIVRREDNIHIIEWVVPLIEEGDIGSIVDPRLQGEFSIESAWKALEIAKSCVPSTAIGRPDISQVLAELKGCLAVDIASRSVRKTRSIKPDLCHSVDVCLEFETDMVPSPR